MERPNEISEELKTISPVLATVERINVFRVPDEYFTDLEKNVTTTIFLNRDKKDNFQSIPEGYFNSLSSTIISRIKEEEKESDKEIKLISPALAYLKEENTYRVPEGYFDTLSEKIIDKIHLQPAKIVSLTPLKKWWKYAAAAVIAGIIAMGSLQLFNQPGSNNNQQEMATSKKIPDYIQLANEYNTPAELKQGINSLTDDEIAKYLEKNTTILDDDALIKNTDTKELPSPDDYLTDDNALNNYLRKINAEGILTNTQ